ncbi:MAG TPA: hypothetical protein VMS32_02120 [Verrucomicrobiae bacterium]|jgi:hypothetical protein|nr:hypothetical protein [Verrucomicrobiae bacterium]
MLGSFWSLVKTLCYAIIPIAAVLFAPAAADAGSQGGPPPLTSLQPEFFVAASGPEKAADSVVAIAVANEFYKQLLCYAPETSKSIVQPCLNNALHNALPRPAIVPQPEWTAEDIAARCASDPSALGGIVITNYYGDATHFFLLWQAEASYLELFAEIIACKPNSAGGLVVAAITQLPGSNGTAWMVHHSQVSIPLLSLAGIGSVLEKGSGQSTSTKTSTNLSTSVYLGAILNQASSRDFPGFSLPVRLRHEGQWVGVDIVNAIGTMCATSMPNGQTANAAQLTNFTPSKQFTSLCQTFNFVSAP